jgi:hypothetical protein
LIDICPSGGGGLSIALHVLQHRTPLSVLLFRKITVKREPSCALVSIDSGSSPPFITVAFLLIFLAPELQLVLTSDLVRLYVGPKKIILFKTELIHYLMLAMHRELVIGMKIDIHTLFSFYSQK